MKTIEELKAFCDGYAHGLITMLTTLQSVDDWVVWGGYDINFAGADYSSHAETDTDLRVDAYKAGWADNIGDPIHSFTI